MLRIVQFKDGKYGIKRGILTNTFLDNKVIKAKNKKDDYVYWWLVDLYVEQNCKFDTLEECIRALQHYKKLESKHDGPDIADISHKTIKWLW